MANTSEDMAPGIQLDYESVYPLGELNLQQTGRQTLTVIALLLTDLLGFIVALSAGLMIRLSLLPAFNHRYVSAIPNTFYSNIWWVSAILIACLVYEGLYSQHLAFWREAKGIITASTLAFLLVLAIISLAKIGGEFSRTTLLLTYFFVIFLLPLMRYISKNLLFRINLWSEPVLILGAGETGQKIARSLASDPFIGYRIFGFLDDDQVKLQEGIDINGVTYHVHGGFQEAAEIIRTHQIPLVIIAVPHMSGDQLVTMANQLKHLTHAVQIVPDLLGISVTGGQLQYLSNDRIVAYSMQNNLGSRLNMIYKRLFDVVIGTIIFILLIPVLLLIMLAIELNSPGPAIYSGYRIGQRGKGFKCYKFRTMYLNNDEILNKYFIDIPEAKTEWEKYAKFKGDDPRVTRIGRFLRRTSLDELPQLVNVLIGDMSLVGARPYLFEEKDRIGTEAEIILMTKPGMTGLWQVSGRNEIDFEGRVELETWYIRNWSLWLDISLLFRTIGVVLGGKGAY